MEDHVADAVAKGATVHCGGEIETHGGGAWCRPTVLTNVSHEMECMREETFGPLAPLFKFDTDDEVIAKANDTIFGLAAYFYASDLSRVTKVSEALEYGMVGINTGLISSAVAPFGGIKESGFGREGSKYGIEDYLEIILALAAEGEICWGGIQFGPALPTNASRVEHLVDGFKPVGVLVLK